MGLLDQWAGDTDLQSPQNQYLNTLAATLLQAGGPSRMPISLGQALGSAMMSGQGAYQAAKDKKLAEDYKNEQLNMLKLDEARKQLDFNNKQEWLKKMNGGDQPSASPAPTQSIQQPLKLGMGADGNMGFQSQPNIQAPQPQAQQSSQTPGQTWLDRVSLADLAAGKFAGIDTDAAIKAKQFLLTGIKRENNTTYIDPNTGKPTYYSDPTKGLDYDPVTKTVTGLAGFNQANAAMKGAEAQAQEQAKAANDLVVVNLPSGPVQMTRAQAVQMAQGQQPMQQQSFNQPMQVPQGQPTLPQAQNPVQNELNQRSAQLRANQPQMDNDRLTILQQELAKETDPNNRAALQREIARVGGQTAQMRPTAPQTGAIAQPVANAPFGIQLQSKAQEQGEVGAVTGKQGTANDLNKNWIDKSYNPVIEAGRTARDNLGSLDALRTIDLKTGWGTEAKANAANVLTGLGIAPANAQMFATNAQKFQSVAMGKLLDTLAAQKGPQTEGDSTRAQKTFTMLQNTPEANQFIADFARAKANMDARRAAFYQEALPIAQQTNDLNEIDRRWMKLQGSIWNDPILQKYKGAK